MSFIQEVIAGLMNDPGRQITVGTTQPSDKPPALARLDAHGVADTSGWVTITVDTADDYYAMWYHSASQKWRFCGAASADYKKTMDAKGTFSFALRRGIPFFIYAASTGGNAYVDVIS